MRFLLTILICACTFGWVQAGPNLARYAATRQQTAASGLWTDPNSYVFLLDEPHSTNTATPIDNSGNGLTVINVGSVGINMGTNATRGLPEYTRYFITDDYVRFTSASTFSTLHNTTIGGWVWHTNRTAYMSVLNKEKATYPYNGWAVYLNYPVSGQWGIYGGTWFTTGIPYSSNTWTFWTLTTETGGAFKFYTNAIQAYTNVFALANHTNTTEGITVGTTGNAGGDFFWGVQDFVFGVSSVLTAGEIATLYNNTGGTNGPLGNIRARLPTAGYP